MKLQYVNSNPALCKYSKFVIRFLKSVLYCEVEIFNIVIAKFRFGGDFLSWINQLYAN